MIAHAGPSGDARAASADPGQRPRETRRGRRHDRRRDHRVARLPARASDLAWTRAWSIEVQLHDDLPLEPKNLDAIVLGQLDLLADIPDDLIGRVVISEDEGSLTAAIHRLITPESTS